MWACVQTFLELPQLHVLCVCIMGRWKNKSRILQPVTTGFLPVWRALSTLSSFLCHWLCCCKWATQDCVIQTIQRPGVCAGEGSESNQTRRKQNPGRKGICSPWLLLPSAQAALVPEVHTQVDFSEGRSFARMVSAQMPRGPSVSGALAQGLQWEHTLCTSSAFTTPIRIFWIHFNLFFVLLAQIVSNWKCFQFKAAFCCLGICSYSEWGYFHFLPGCVYCIFSITISFSLAFIFFQHPQKVPGKLSHGFVNLGEARNTKGAAA